MSGTGSIGLSVEAAASIHEVPAGRWDTLAGADHFYLSYGWLSTVERDRTARARYLTALLDGKLVGALPIYQVEFEGSAFYRPERLQSLLGVAGRHLIAGTRRCYRSGVLLAPWLPATVQDRVAKALVHAAAAEAAAGGMSGVALFCLPTADLERLGRVAPLIAAFDSAETTIDGIGAGIMPFLDRLSRKRRGEVRREMRTFAATGWRTEVTRLADCLPEVADLVSRVEQRHGQVTPEVLLRRLFRRQVQDVDDRAVVFTCRDDGDALVACAVNYLWRDTLYTRAVGLDYDRIGQSFAYFNLLIYRAIEYAAEHGLDRLHLGLPSAAKLKRGGVISPLWTAVVPADTAGQEPGIELLDPAAMRRWSEPYLRHSNAFANGAWVMPH